MKEIVDVRRDESGKITFVKFDDNMRFTSIADATKMADKGQIQGYHTVHRKGEDNYLRSNPDGDVYNNLSNL